MKNIGFVFFFLFSCVLLLAQSTFQKTFHLQDDDITFNYMTNVNDTIIGVGFISDTPFIYDNNIVSATDQKGKTLWSSIYKIDTLSLSVTDILTSRDNSIILLSELRNGNQPLNSNSQNVLSKFSSDGAMIWSKQFVFQNYYLRRFKDIVEVPNGDFIIGGNNYLVRLDSNGEKLWEKEIVLGEDYIYRHLISMPDNSVMLIGTKQDTDFFNLGFPNVNFNTVICNVSSDGTVNWSKVIKGLHPSHARLFPNGEMLLLGYSLQNFKQIKLVRLQADGEVVLIKNVSIQNVAFDPHFSLILPDGSVALYITNPQNEPILLKLNANLDFEWSRTYPISGYSILQAYSSNDMFVALSDDSFAMLYEEQETTTSEQLDFTFLLRKTDHLGKLDACYYSSLCPTITDVAIFESIEVEFISRDFSNEVTTSIIDANGHLEPIDIDTQFFCEKHQYPSPYFALSDTLCINTPITIDSLCQENADLWRWKNANNTLSSQSNPQDIQFEEAGIQQLTHIIETDGCLDTFSRNIQIVDAPNFNIGQDTVLCEDTPFIWNIEQGDLRNYTWSDSLNSPSREITESGVYTAFAHDAYCEVRSSRSIDFIHDLFPEQPIDLGEDTTICEQIPLLLHATQLDASNYLWENGSTLPTRNISESGVYRLSFNLAGCPFEEEIVVETEDCAGKIYIPTAFSPNGDGNNDFFQIETKYVDITRIQIFNRWGALVYEGTAAWDGTINGKEAAEGIYICKMEYLENLLDRMYQVSNELLLTR